MKSKKVVHVCTADLHVGSTLGLCPPKATVDLGGAYTPNVYQKWMWKCWNYAWDWVEEKIKEIKPAHTHLSIVGDLVDIDAKGRSGQIWARDQKTASDCTIAILEPVVQGFDTLMVIKGTEAHGGLNNKAEETIAENFDNHVPCSETGEAAWWSADAELGGVLFNLAHHGRMGYRQWTKKNPLYTLRGDIIMNRVNEKKPIPDVAVRAHFHQYHKTDVDEMCVVVQLPGWQMKNAFTHRIDPTDTRPQVGLVMFVCEEGRFDLIAKTYVGKRSRAWKPTQRNTKKK